MLSLWKQEPGNVSDLFGCGKRNSIYVGNVIIRIFREEESILFMMLVVSLQCVMCISRSSCCFHERRTRFCNSCKLWLPSSCITIIIFAQYLPFSFLTIVTCIYLPPEQPHYKGTNMQTSSIFNFTSRWREKTPMDVFMTASACLVRNCQKILNIRSLSQDNTITKESLYFIQFISD